MDEMQMLETMGFALPSPAYLCGLILFGVVGYAAYRYGKNASLTRFKWIGVALMLYPYVVSDTWQLYSVGALLCVGLYFSRD